MELLWESRPSWTLFQRCYAVAAALGVGVAIYMYVRSGSPAPDREVAAAPVEPSAPSPSRYADALELAAMLNADHPTPPSLAPEQARSAFSQSDPSIPASRPIATPTVNRPVQKRVSQSSRPRPAEVRPGGSRTGAAFSAQKSLFTRIHSSAASDRLRASPVN